MGGSRESGQGGGRELRAGIAGRTALEGARQLLRGNLWIAKTECYRESDPSCVARRTRAP